MRTRKGRQCRFGSAFTRVPIIRSRRRQPGLAGTWSGSVCRWPTLTTSSAPAEAWSFGPGCGRERLPCIACTRPWPNCDSKCSAARSLRPRHSRYRPHTHSIARRHVMWSRRSACGRLNTRCAHVLDSWLDLGHGVREGFGDDRCRRRCSHLFCTPRVRSGTHLGGPDHAKSLTGRPSDARAVPRQADRRPARGRQIVVEKADRWFYRYFRKGEGGQPPRPCGAA